MYLSERRDFSIREATAADRPRLAAIFAVVRQAMFVGRESVLGSAADFERSTAGEAILVAQLAAGPCIGFASIWEPDRFVHHLYVDPNWQGRGAGTALLEALRDRFPTPHRLKCLVQNERALGFYARAGWTRISAGASDDGDYWLLESPE